MVSLFRKASIHRVPPWMVRHRIGGAVKDKDGVPDEYPMKAVSDGA